MKICKNFIICFGDMRFWKLANQLLPYEPEVVLFCDVTKAVMKINHFSVCYESNKLTFIIHRTKKILISDKKRINLKSRIQKRETSKISMIQKKHRKVLQCAVGITPMFWKRLAVVIVVSQNVKVWLNHLEVYNLNLLNQKIQISVKMAVNNCK